MKYLLYTILIMMSSPLLVSAGSIELSGPDRISFDDIVRYEVFLDSEGEAVNTITGTLTLSGNADFIRTQTGKSVISLWIVEPVVEGGEIVTFTGVIPGGLSGERLPLFDVFVWSGSKGKLSINGQGEAFLNNGEGSSIVLNTTQKDITIDPQVDRQPRQVDDHISPEEFVPQIVRDEALYEGAYTIVFTAQDKGAGISYYEMQESSNDVPDQDMWERATSPYRLVDQGRDSYVFVKAVDHNGNIRVAVVAPESSGSGLFVTMSVIIVLLALVLVYRYRKNVYDTRIG